MELKELEYDGVEYDGLDEKIAGEYNEKKEVYSKRLENLYAKYPNLPKTIEDLINLDRFKFLKQNNGNWENENVDGFGEDLAQTIEQIIDLKQKLEELENEYKCLKTVVHRLVYRCACARRENVPGLIREVNSKPIIEADKRVNINLGDREVVSYEQLRYTTATNVDEYINKYMVKGTDGNEEYVYTDIPPEYLKDPEFVNFLDTVMLNKEYIKFAIKKNKGILGTPRKTEDGHYIVEFDSDVPEAVKADEEKRKSRIERITDGMYLGE